MKELGAREAKNRFGQFLDAAQRGPVRLTKKGRPVGVMLSQQQYDRLLGAAWERLQTTVDAMREQAEENGLTEETLAELLRDES